MSQRLVWYVICSHNADESEYISWISSKSGLLFEEGTNRYITGYSLVKTAGDIKIENPIGVFIGKWYTRRDIFSIIERLESLGAPSTVRARVCSVLREKLKNGELTTLSPIDERKLLMYETF